MNYSFFDLFKLIGSLGLFLYGMKMMSEGLQKVAGDKLRGILTAMTSTRVTGVLTGLLITVLIQSSSATTVMVVSFVNAGLLTLVQAVGVIMGANIGTTVTAWIISIFGFKFSISAISIPLIGLSIPLIFSTKSFRKSLGEFLVGFALLFLGLDFLKNSVPDLKSNPEMLSFLQNYTSLGYGSILLFVLVGTIITIIVQSSSATMAITLIMCGMGWIPFHVAAAMVLGENIGTTITANLAALTANVSAKRAALSHMMFNIIGVIWVLALFYPFMNIVATVIDYLGVGNPLTMSINDPDYQVAASYALSLFHTLFNVTNTFIMVWFVKSIANIVTKVIPSKESDEEFHLKYISTSLMSTAEISLIQAKSEIQFYGERSLKMLGILKDLQNEKNEAAFLKIFARLEKYEGISDRVEIEIANYLSKVAEGRLSSDSKHEVHNMMRTVTEIESVDDSCYNLGRAFIRKNECASPFTDQIQQNIDQMHGLVEQALNALLKVLALPENSGADIFESEEIEDRINELRNELKSKNVEAVNAHEYDYAVGVIYMDIIMEYEKMGDYIINVVEAATGRCKVV